jgi:hypothetical protein
MPSLCAATCPRYIDLQTLWDAPLNPPWKCKAFGDVAPEERNWIVQDNTMSACYMGRKKSYEKGVPKKTPLPIPECQGEHICWLHEILGVRKTQITKPTKQEKE